MDAGRSVPDEIEGGSPLTNVLERLGDPRQRRAVRLLEPAAQLKLPLFLLAITLVFVAVSLGNAYFAFARFYDLAMTTVPPAFHETVREQTLTFLILSGLIGVAYALAVLCFAIAYTHRLVGPSVAFRRHLYALRHGDYGERVSLRRGGSAFRDVARGLNLLAEQLQRGTTPAP